MCRVPGKRKKLLLAVLILGLVGVYGFSDMKTVFYDILKSALGLSDFRLSQLWGAFGISALFSYIIGGHMADKIAPQKLIFAALMVSGILHLIMSCVPSFNAMRILSVGMGLCAVLLFFPASSKLITEIGEDTSGKTFGIYYGAGGFLTAATALAGTLLYINLQNELLVFIVIMRCIGFVDMAAGILIVVFFWKLPKVERDRVGLLFSDILQIVRRRDIWFIALITMCNYLVCCMMTYYTPYLSASFGLPENYGLFFGTIRLGVFCLTAGIIWGRWSDWMHSSICVIRLSFFGMTALFLLLILNELVLHKMFAALLITLMLCLCSLGVKAITLVMISETQIPLAMTGTVVGMVSFIGYCPDALFYPIAGWVLEIGGNGSYLLLFGTALVCIMIGSFCCEGFIKTIK